MQTMGLRHVPIIWQFMGSAVIVRKIDRDSPALDFSQVTQAII